MIICIFTEERLLARALLARTAHINEARVVIGLRRREQLKAHAVIVLDVHGAVGVALHVTDERAARQRAPDAAIRRVLVVHQQVAVANAAAIVFARFTRTILSASLRIRFFSL